MTRRDERTLGRIARLLELIETTPNRRTRPLPGDVPGEFDFWFDGGACVGHTGNTTFRLADGTEAIAGSTFELHLTIVLPGGTQVRISETPPPEAAEPQASDTVVL